MYTLFDNEKKSFEWTLIFVAYIVFKNVILKMWRQKITNHVQVFGNSNECKDSTKTGKTIEVCPQNINEWMGWSS